MTDNQEFASKLIHEGVRLFGWLLLAVLAWKQCLPLAQAVQRLISG